MRAIYLILLLLNIDHILCVQYCDTLIDQKGYLKPISIMRLIGYEEYYMLVERALWKFDIIVTNNKAEVVIDIDTEVDILGYIFNNMIVYSVNDNITDCFITLKVIE